jgi:lysophospholipase L1-like esterase
MKKLAIMTDGASVLGLAGIRKLLMKSKLIAIVFALSFAHCSAYAQLRTSKQWVGTWGTARQLVEPNNRPPSPGLSNNTLRQIVCVSTGGKLLRVKLSNEFSKGPVNIKMVQIALSKGGCAVDGSSTQVLKFNGLSDITIPAGVELYSDPLTFQLKPRTEIAITITFGEAPATETGHPGSRTTSYLLAGEHSEAGADFSNAVKTDHWYIISGIDVEAPKKAGAVVVFGDSITDGRGSGTNKQDRWPDVLSMNLLANKRTRQVGVINMGIGGNTVLKGGLGPMGKDRFDHDVLQQSGVRWLIILEGVNDLGGARDSVAAANVANDLIAAYGNMIRKAQARGIKVYGATILPFKKSTYYTPAREAARNKVNEWIRNSGNYDAVIDFDKVMRDPNDPAALLDRAQSGANDHLHPNQVGYQMMGKAVDVKLFK